MKTPPDRRDFILTLGASALSLPLIARAQEKTKKLARIGVLWHAESEAAEAKFLAEFRRGLRDLGYEEGRNITLVNRFPAEKPELFNSLGAELAGSNLDALVAVTLTAALAFQRAATTTPTVFLLVSDPVGKNLVKSLAHPGGIFTGVSSLYSDLTLKRVQLLKEAVPTVSRVIFVVNANNLASYPSADAQQVIAEKLKVAVRMVEVRNPADIDSAFSSIAPDRSVGLVVGPDALLYVQSARISALALERRLPTIFPWKEGVEAGGLLSYGADIFSMFYRGAYYVDKILKGAKPADIPVEQPTVFTMAINSRTAKTLGITFPNSILLSADTVIE